MNSKRINYTDTSNFEIGELVKQQLSSVRCWFQNISTERKNIELQKSRRREMLAQLQKETIENLTFELKSTLSVPR